MAFSLADLAVQGYKVIPVNPREAEKGGECCTWMQLSLVEKWLTMHVLQGASWDFPALQRFLTSLVSCI